MSDAITEELARKVLDAARLDDRCAELLICLFEGGSATVEPTGTLALATAEQLAGLAAEHHHEQPRRLTFDEVTATNTQRCGRWHPGFPNDEAWTGADWSNAVCGEAGELANVVKKLRRFEVGTTPGALDPPEHELRQALANECADVYLYLDLLATYYRIDLPASVIAKFNVVSERQGFPERLRGDA